MFLGYTKRLLHTNNTMKAKARFIFSALILMISPVIAYALDPLYNSHRNNGVVRGYDVVAYFDLEPGDKAVKGKKELSTVWHGAKWYFSTQENLEKFKANPTAYAPQYGGYCAFAVGKNFTTSIRPNSWQIHNGKLYLNHNEASKKYFNKDLESRIAKADANWPAVLSECEKRNRCRKPPKLNEP